MNYKIVLISVVLVLVFSSCKYDDNIITPPKRSSKNEIVPLSVGNYWKYKFTDYESSNPTIRYSEEHITQDTIIDFQEYFVLEQVGFDNKMFSFNDNSGYNQIPNIFDFNFGMYVKYPAQVGDEFYYNQFVDSVKIISINKKITVPAGTFECYHYQSFDTFSRMDESGNVIEKLISQLDFYYSVGVGLVLTDNYIIKNNQSTLFTKQELIEYNVK